MLYLFLFLFSFFSLFSQEDAFQEKVTPHTLKLGDEALEYTVTVSPGKVGAISYIKNTTENRPITFAFNGGPGSSSVWLHLGALGPRRVLTPEEGQTNHAPYQLTDNLETILDLTDLVFIDPTGTGINTEEDQDCYSVKGDIESISHFIRNYLTETKRWNSPKYFAGESYGATRALGIADYLQSEFGIFPNGLILISCALDFQTFIFAQDNLLPYLLFFPTYATTARYHGLISPEKSTKEVAKLARQFVFEKYASALICPSCFDQEPIYREVSNLSGLPYKLIKKKRGRIAEDLFYKELLADQEVMVGRMDSRVTGHFNNALQDPSITTIQGIFSGGFHEYLHKELDVQSSYTLFSKNVNFNWNFHDYNPWGYPSLMYALRNTLQSNPKMKLFVACGYYDLATPFAAIEYSLNHLDQPDASIQLEYYEGGHMFYLSQSPREKFKKDLIKFFDTH